jgi:hypothetical protein
MSFAVAAGAAERPALDSREKAWSLATQLELARDKGEPISASWSSGPVVPVINAPMDNPDVAVTTASNRTQSENSIAVSPLDNKVLFNSNNSTDFPVTTVLGASAFVSTDGGLTWSGDSNGPGGFSNRGDPAAMIDLTGKLYLGYIHNSGGMGVSYSTDMGANWTHVAVTTASGQDKNHLMVDIAPGSPFAGRVYNSWVDLSGGSNDNDIVFTFSSNGGANWSTITNISDGVAAGSHSQGVNIQTGPSGEVYCAWSVYDAFPADETAIGFNKSTDGGVTWLGESRKITNIRGIRSSTLPNESTRANSFPSMAVDISGGPRNGWIYIFWTNIGVPGVNTGDADIYMARSTNGGTTFGTPIRVNDDVTTRSQYFPWASCDPVTGELSVAFYDRRDDAGDLLTTTYVAHSLDGGTTWENFRVGDVQFTPAPIPGLAGGYMGDYIGMASRGGRAYPCWGDHRVSPFLTYVSPIAYSDPTDPNPPTGVSAYSDYSTPTSVLLNWTDPTTYANGSPIGDFSIDIYRDAAFVINVDQGMQTYLDGGRTDGVEYDYELRAHDDVTDSLSLPVNVSATAGGSPTPAPPTGLVCTADSVAATLTWTNPVDQDDGSPLDDFAGIKVYRNNTLIQTLARAVTDTGLADMYVDTPAPGFVYTYEVSAFDNEVPVNESTRDAHTCFVGSVPNILVWQPSPLATTSGTEIYNVLSGLGESVFYSQNLFEFGTNLNQHEILFVVNGIYPNNHVMNTTEGAAIEAFVNAGGRLYLESGDGFNYDPESASGYNFRPIFGLNDGPDGSADLANLTGVNDLSGMTSAYSGGNNFIDELQPATSTAIWQNSSNPDIVGVFNVYGSGRAIGCSHEFGGLDGGSVASLDYIWIGPVPYEGGSLPIGPTKPPAGTPEADAFVATVEPFPAGPETGESPSLGVTTPDDIMTAYLQLLRQTSEPNIVVNVAGLADTLVELTTGSVSFTVKNQGILASPLIFTIAENPAVGWASVSPSADTLLANEQVTITVDLTAAGLNSGSYSTTLDIASNDTSDPLETVALDLLVIPRPIMVLDHTNFDFTILAGDTIVDDFILYNNGGGLLNYNASVDFVSGPSTGSTREEFFNITGTPSPQGMTSRGNVYSVTTATTLTKQEFYLNLSAATDLEFFVYQGNAATGSFTKIYSSGTQVMGPGAQFYASPSMSVSLLAGKFYYIGTAWNQTATYYHDNGTFGPPETTTFGQLRYGVTTGSGFPAPASTSLVGSILVFPQAITTGYGIQTVMLTPSSGTVPDSSSTLQTFRAASLPLSPLGTYHFNLKTTGNDPVVPIHLIDLQINVVGTLTGVNPVGGSIPTAFALRPNEPNPFNPLTKIRFDLPQESRVALTVFDAAGRRVKSLVSERMGAGRYEVPWNGTDDGGTAVGSGVYLLRMDAGTFSDRVKMTLVK